MVYTLENELEQCDEYIKDTEEYINKLKTELNEYAINEAYKPKGLIAEKIKKHFESFSKVKD